MAFQRAARLDRLPPYLFIEIDRKKRVALAAGRDVINLGIGDPDRPTMDFVLDRMSQSIRDARHHRYSPDTGLPEFRETAAAWFAQRFGVSLDPAAEVLTLIGTKEGLGHLPLGVVNPGDIALIPSPGYPVYNSATIFAGGEPFVLPLLESNRWLPDFGVIPADVLNRTALMFLNYPNNPIGATANLDFLASAVALAKKHDFVIVHDAAYTEVYFDSPPPSILQVPGAKDVAIEMHSLSKTFNMTGWRLGFGVGNANVLAALAKVKGNVDSSAFGAIQEAGAEALRRIDGPQVTAMRDLYRRRRDRFAGGLRAAGFRVTPPAATFYMWVPCPDGYDSMGCINRMLEEQFVIAIPGSGFGPAGEGYVRFSLTAADERLDEAAARLQRIRW